METTKLVYYQKQVGYDVGVRRHAQDTQGYMLTREQPWVGVPQEGLRDFKIANKRALSQGLIKEVEEPSVDIQTPNAVGDDEIEEALKQVSKTKKLVESITSEPILYRILQRAKEKRLSDSTIEFIEERLELFKDETTIDMDAVSRRVFEQ